MKRETKKKRIKELQRAIAFALAHQNFSNHEDIERLVKHLLKRIKKLQEGLDEDKTP
jgi:hypothetical protein